MHDSQPLKNMSINLTSGWDKYSFYGETRRILVQHHHDSPSLCCRSIVSLPPLDSYHWVEVSLLVELFPNPYTPTSPYRQKSKVFRFPIFFTKRLTLSMTLLVLLLRVLPVCKRSTPPSPFTPSFVPSALHLFCKMSNSIDATNFWRFLVKNCILVMYEKIGTLWLSVVFTLFTA